jgi:hypothetical protein
MSTKSKGTTTKSKRQVGYLLSKGSPLSPSQKAKLKNELHTGAVKVSNSSARNPRAQMNKQGKAKPKR